MRKKERERVKEKESLTWAIHSDFDVFCVRDIEKEKKRAREREREKESK